MAKKSLGGKFIDRTNKRFGKGSANFLGEREPIESISTGSIGVNWIIGPHCQGFPLGGLSQIYGGEKAGKSFFCCKSIVEAQNAGLPVWLVDRERHYTPEWFDRFGGDRDDVIDLHPAAVEDCFDMVEDACNILIEEDLHGGLFVIDSLQSMTTRAVFEDSAATEGMHAMQRWLSSHLGKYVEKIYEAGLALVIVGQIRSSPNPYASEREYTPGGNALAHLSRLRLKLKFKNIIKEKDPNSNDEYRVGWRSTVTTTKNDVGGIAPYREIVLSFYDGGGVDDTDALFYIAKRVGILEAGKVGYYTIPSLDLKFRGQGAWPGMLEENPEIRDLILNVAFDPEVVLNFEASSLTSRSEESDE